MNRELTKEIICNLDLILAPSLISGNFPFDKSSIQRKIFIKGYLISHIFQNRLFGAMSSHVPALGYKGIMIGSLSKTYQKENGEIGDHSNLFLKNYLNKNGVKTAEILIPNLRDIILLKYLPKANLFVKNNSFILPYPKQRLRFNIDRLDLQNKLLDRIKNIRKSEEVDVSWRFSKNLDFIEKNIGRYVNFIGSKEFIGYLFTIALSLDNLFRMIKPKFVIANSLSGNRDRLAIFIAHKNNIKVLFVPHGIGGSLAIPRYIKEDDIPVDAYASGIYSANEKRKIYNQKEVWYLGPLWLGYLLNARNNTIPINNGNKKHPVILYVSQPFAKDKCITEGEYVSFLTKTFGMFKELHEMAGIRWLIKLHPRDDVNFYRKILSKTGLEVKLLEKPSSICIEDLQDLSPDIVVSPYSTFAMEMIILKKVVIGLLPHSFKEKLFPDSDYSKATIPLYPELYTERSLQNFKKSILEFLNNTEKREEKRNQQEKFMKEKGIWLNQDSLESFLKCLADFIDK